MEQESYQRDSEFCNEIEDKIEENPEDFLGWQRKMLASRKIRRYQGDYPKVVLHLLDKGNIHYEPDLSILETEIN